MDILADTVFLIDLWREASSPGRATAYARAHASQQVGIPWIVAGEFLSGAMAAGQDRDLVAAFLSRYPVVQSDAATIRRYAELYVQLRAGNALIGPNDLWIAAAASAVPLPLLTRNVAEFQRVPGLQVVDYTKPPG